jgi:hypothetical protein
MRIWKLAPTDLTDPIWKKWSPEPIIVRAENEAEARDWAELKTMKTFPATPGLPIQVNPWGGYNIEDSGPQPTFCEDITEQTDEYSVHGPPEVLRHGEKFEDLCSLPEVPIARREVS